VGGRFGSESSDQSGKSISMNEMLKAIELNKQTYIFIDKNVNTEFSTYSRNSTNEIDINYAYVDDIRIYKFIETLKSKPNVIINDFSTANDIVDCLRSQWAGLFQTFLFNKEQQRQSDGLLTLKSVIEQLVDVSDRLNKNAEDVVTSSNSIFTKLEISKQFISPSLIEISNELLGHGNGVLLFRIKSELDAFIANTLNFQNDMDEGHYYNNDLSLFIDFDFVFDKEKKLIYRTQKEIVDYEKVHNKKFVFIEKRTNTFFSLETNIPDEDLPF